jgi:phage shock protein PspC (stress-responsive transcriptional regulator)
MTNQPVDPDRTPEDSGGPAAAPGPEPSDTAEPTDTAGPAGATAAEPTVPAAAGPAGATAAGPAGATAAGPSDTAEPEDATEPATPSDGAGSPPPAAGSLPPFGSPPPAAGFPPPFGSPPSAGFPPPGGFPPPPPGTSGWATRYGLVRPAQGRMVAGVCAAVGRATNTDPVLWRVLFAVLTLAGGVGLLAYVLGWLFIPAEGDTASPVEALLGRGRSSTSPVLVIIVGVIAAIALGSVLYDGLRSAAILLAVILGAIILISRGGAGANAGPPADPTMPAGGLSDDRLTVVPPPPPTWAAAPPGSATVPTAPPLGYRPPFAPHGPYATASRYPYPGLAFTPAPVPPPPPPVRPRPAPVRSRLGRFTLSLGLLVLGLLAVVDVVGARVPFAVYAGALLAVVGLGLILGAWFGRSRGLIPIGLLLTLIVAVGFGAHGRMNGMAKGGDVTLTPSTVAAIGSEYHQNFGDFTLDLTNVDFTGVKEPKEVRITMNVGDLTILIPPRVDTTVHAKVNLGDARVFDNKWGGIGSPQRDVVDNDTDGPGGGTLIIDVQLNAGDLGVHR